jgi:hypothetical protein
MTASTRGWLGTVGVTVLGAGVVLGEALLDLLSRLLAHVDDEGRAPRHNAGMVREQVRAAARAARAAGVFRHGKRRR